MSRQTIFISVIVTVIVLCALAIFLIIYFLLYNRKLSKAVEEGRADRPMPAISVYAMMFLCMVFLAASVFSVSGITELGSKLDSLSEQEKSREEKLGELETALGYCMDLIWSAKEDISKSSIVYYTLFSYGDYHPESHTIDAEIMTAPKVTAAENVTFYCGDQVIKLSQDKDGLYKGSFSYDIFSRRTEGLLTFGTGTVTLSEIVYDDKLAGNTAAYTSLVADIIPAFGIDTNETDPTARPDHFKDGAFTEEKTDTDKGTFEFYGDYRFCIVSPEKYPSFEVGSVKVICQQNGKTVGEQDITEDYRKGRKDASTGGIMIPSVIVEQKIGSYSPNDYVEILLSITDKSGYTYQTILHCKGLNNVRADNNMVFQDSGGRIVYVYDKDGNELKPLVLYSAAG